jgi:hypothetical protein
MYNNVFIHNNQQYIIKILITSAFVINIHNIFSEIILNFFVIYITILCFHKTVIVDALIFFSKTEIY